MTISDINHSGLHSIINQPTINALEKNKKLLASCLTATGNTILTLTKKCNQEAVCIKGCHSLLERLKTIATQKGNDSSVRLKNDTFKSGQTIGVMNKLFNGGRYLQEKKAAAELFDIKGKDLSAGEGIRILEQELMSKKNHFNALQNELIQISKEYEQLAQMKSDIDMQLRADATTRKTVNKQ